MPRVRENHHNDYFTGTPSPDSIWRQLCDVIAHELGGTRVVILPLSRERYVPWVAHSVGYGTILEQFYAEGWTLKDLQIEISDPNPIRGYLRKEDLVFPEGIEKSLLNRFFLSCGTDGGWIGFVVAHRNLSWIVSIDAPVSNQPESSICARKVADLQLKVVEQLETAEQELKSRWQEISLTHQHLGVGLLVLNVAGDVIEADVRAIGFLKRFGINAYRGNFKKQFPDLYFPKKPNRASVYSGPYIIGKSEDAMLSAAIIRLPQSLHMITCEAIEIISLSLRTPFMNTLRAVMLERFALLPSEVELAVLLCEGRKVKEAAEMIRIKESTARQRLKSIFRKVEVETQHQLLVVLFRQVGFLPPSEKH